MIFAQQYYGFRNIDEFDGWGISITGISIVFAALVLISLFITCLPRVLAMLSKVLPPEVDHRAAAARPSAQPDQDDALVAAIGFALHSRQRDHK